MKAGMHSALMVLWKERKETKEDYADRRSQEKLTVNMSFPLASANVKGGSRGGRGGRATMNKWVGKWARHTGASRLKRWSGSICQSTTVACTGYEAKGAKERLEEG